MQYRQQPRMFFGRMLNRIRPTTTPEGRLRGSARAINYLAVLSLVLGLFLPLTTGAVSAAPEPRATSDAVGQTAVGAATMVVVIGDFQSQFGCSDWDGSCSATQLGNSGGIWSGNLPIAPGNYSAQFAVVTADGQQHVFGNGGENGSDLTFSVNDGQAGAWFSWDSHDNTAEAVDIDALYAVETDLGAFVPAPRGGNLVALVPSQGGTITATLTANGAAVGSPQQVQLDNGWTEVTFDTAGNLVDVAGNTYGTLTIVRLDENGNPAPGGCYVLSDGQQVNQACDGDDGNWDGQIFMQFPDGLTPGTYTLIETSTPDGVGPVDDQSISLDASDNTVQLQSPGGQGGEEPTSEVVEPTTEQQTEAQPGDLIVTLQDDLGNLVGGACWQLLQDGEVIAETCDIDDANPFNGKAGFFGVASGVYTLRMSQPPDGVSPVADIDGVEIQPGVEGSQVVTVASTPTQEPEAQTGDVVVLRQDLDGNAVGGSCFMLVADDSSVVANEVCDEDGDFPDDGRTGFFGVPVGTWWVVETRTPDGYETASSTQVTVAAGTSVDIVVASSPLTTEEPTQQSEFPTEEPQATEVPQEATQEPTLPPTETGNLQVNLSDPDGNLIGGACWQLVQGDQVVAEACDLEGTNDNYPLNGKVGFYDIPAGDYVLRMSLVPEGYQPVGDQDVAIQPGDGLFEVVILPVSAPTEEPTSVPELPTEEPTEVPAAPTEEPTAEPTQEPGGPGNPGNLIVTLQDENGNNVGGACFELVFNDAVVSSSCDADDPFPDNGRTGFFNVPSGTYTLRQTNDIAGYQPVADTEVTVDEGLDSNTHVTVRTVPIPVEPTEEPAAPTEIPQGETGLRVDATQLDPAAGPVCIELNTTSTIGMRNPPAACDNGDGDADPTSGVILLLGVAPGEYSFFVRSGSRSVVGAEWPNVIVEDGKITDLVLPPGGVLAEPPVMPTEEPTAAPQPGSIQVQVRDTAGDLIEEAGSCVTVVGVSDSICDNQPGDADPSLGVVQIDNVPAGTWTVTNEQAPEGYEIGSDIEGIAVDEGAGTRVVLTLEQTLGIVRVVAVDASNTPLPGACWKLMSGDAEVASQCDDDTNGGIANDGYATMEGILPGTYTLVETQTPVGFLPAAERDITVGSGENEPILVVHDVAVGAISVTTVDDADAPLTGACYTLDGGSEQCGDGTTVVFDGVTPGSHTIAQSTAPTGFAPAEAQVVDLPPSETLPVQFVNSERLTGAARFTLTLDGNPIGGLCLETTRGDGVCDNQAGDGDTTAGIVLIDGFVPGDYAATLGAVPQGAQDPGSRDFTIIDGETTDVLFELVSLPPVTANLTVLVQDSEGAAVANGCVVLRSGSTDVFGPICDNDAGDTDPTVGTIALSGIEIGSYTVALTDDSKANIDGFASASEPSVTVQEGADNQATIVVELEQAVTTGGIELVTVDNASNMRIPGACYDLVGGATISVCDGDASDLNSSGGVIQLVEIPAGDYNLVPTTAPAGYQEPAARTVTVTAGAVNTYEIRLDRLPQAATVTVLKVDANDAPLPGACFAIRQGSITIQTACDNSNGQPNDGTIVFEGLAAGTYQLVETRSPSPEYQLSSPIEFTVVAGEAREITVVNTIRAGRLVVTKVDAADATLRLENACFALQGDTTYGPFCDGDDGAVDGRTIFPNVIPGAYTLVETTPPAGYLPAANRDVTINPGASVNLTVADAKAPPPAKKGDLVVNKVDAGGDPLAGACFRLFDGNVPITPQICDAADGANDGVIRFSGVPVGTWTLRETVTPSTDFQWADPQDVTIRENQTTNAEVANVLKPGRIQVNKRSPEGRPLQGACFDIQGDSLGELCTDTTGVVIFSGLEPGVYTLVETRAPQGFDPVANVANITVKPGQTTIVNLVNQRTPPPANTGSILVQKFVCPAGEGGARTSFFGGAQGAQQLARTAGCTRGSATFTLIEDDGEGGPGQFTTGADGQHQMTAPEGIYRLTETTHGNASVRVRISRGQMTTVIVINYVEPPKPQETVIQVWKWTCTPSFNGTLWQDFAEACSREEQLTNGITVRLEGPVTAKAVTGDGGQRGRTSFTGLTPGSYTIYEERPATIPVGYLFCGFNSASPSDWKAVNGSLTVQIQYGQTLVCQFFDIPADLTPNTGTILVHKFVCEIDKPAKGYDFEKECRLSDQGVSFSLAWFNAERQDFDEPTIATANPDGILWLTRLEPGTYRLREVDNLWCHAESNNVNAQGDVLVRANQLSEVWIYNCVPPAAPPNTGSGDAAPNPPPADLPTGASDPRALPTTALPLLATAVWVGIQRRMRRYSELDADRAA